MTLSGRTIGQAAKAAGLTRKAVWVYVACCRAPSAMRSASGSTPSTMSRC